MARVREETMKGRKGGKVAARVRKELKGNEGEWKTVRVVPLAANEYLINLLAWMYLISRRRESTRVFKSPAKSWGSSYQRVNPFLLCRTNVSCGSAPLTLSSASSYSVSFLAYFRSLTFFSCQAEGNHEYEKKGSGDNGDYEVRG